METRHSRQSLRREIRLKRKALSPNQQNTAATELANHLCHSSLFSQSQKIAAYLASDGEISPHRVVEAVAEGEVKETKDQNPFDGCKKLRIVRVLQIAGQAPTCAYVAPVHWRDDSTFLEMRRLSWIRV